MHWKALESYEFLNIRRKGNLKTSRNTTASKMTVIWKLWSYKLYSEDFWTFPLTFFWCWRFEFRRRTLVTCSRLTWIKELSPYIVFFFISSTWPFFSVKAAEIIIMASYPVCTDCSFKPNGNPTQYLDLVH